MPTMGRLVGAILFGVLAWYVSGLIAPLFPESTNLGFFREVNTLVGLYAGWTVAGSRAGLGYTAAFSYGLTGMVAMVVIALFLHSGVVMLEKSLRKTYDNAGAAVVDVFSLFMEHGAMLFTPEILGTLIGGGIVAGLVTEFFGSKYS